MGRHGLTSRQTQIMDMVAAGLSNKRVGEALAMRAASVSNQLTSIYRKLGITDGAQDMRRYLAIEWWRTHNGRREH